MPLRAGRHTVGPQNGSLLVRTYREGVAQKVGHDLVIDVAEWQAEVESAEGGSLSSVELSAQPGSFQVREGLGGVKPLTEKDRGDIRQTILDKILGQSTIEFRSSGIQGGSEEPTIDGQLTIAGASRPVSARLALTAEGRVSATIPLVQSDWKIKPYRALMGALKVRDEVEIVLDVQLPTA